MSRQFHRAMALALSVGAALASPQGFAEDAPPPLSFSVERYQVEGDNPLEPAVTEGILTPYTGIHEGLAGIDAASQALEVELQRRGYAFHRVIVPPQRAEGGVFTLRVLAFKLRDVQVAGNRFFGDDNILASMPALVPGKVPDNLAISRSADLANQHPSKRVGVFLKESDTPGFIDARIETRDVRPWQIFASLSNTGSEETGHNRLAVGYQHSNLFDRDHALTLSYTTSPGHAGEVKQRGVHYRIPIYEQHLALSLFYTDSEVDQGRIGQFFDVSGSGRFKGADLEYTLNPQSNYRHKVRAQIQDKLFEDDSLLTFQGVPLTIGSDVRTRPVSLSYIGRWDGAPWNGGFDVGYHRNLQSGNHNDDRDYQAVTNGFGHSSWDALRVTADIERQLPSDWLFRGRLAAQYANETLVSGEQFGLGGATNVRGFEEREISGDNGVRVNLEAWAPELSSNLEGLLFLDHGWLERERTVAGVKGTESVSSAGVGLRWHWKTRLTLAVDAAKVLNGAQETDRYDGRLHFNLFARF
ncbi:MAG: ShlB/FhaC/HecB family hemolysin secretion/activation protein [Gammaproteobacteria bacterium]|nr:ShlB/FhaC/HecB family hemolysin secretion/activation protein [Gammaproteobacteria bacterium]